MLAILLEGLNVKIYGVPAHPLLVHVAARGARAHRHRLARGVAPHVLPADHAMAVAGAGATFFAKQTGEGLVETVRQTGKRIGDHPEQGGSAFVFSALLAMACVALYVYHEYGERIRERIGWTDRFRLPVNEHAALYAVSLPIAALAIGTMIVAGHSGAQLVWKSTP